MPYRSLLPFATLPSLPLSDSAPSTPEPAPDALQDLLDQVSQDSPEAQGQLFSLLYEELHRQARRYMPRNHPGETLQPTALVNEAYLRLCKGRTGGWRNREHFLKTAAQAMRHVLVDHSRKKEAVKRQKGKELVPLEGLEVAHFEDRAHNLDKLDQALNKLAAFDPQMAQAVELRFFGGASFPEASKILNIAQRTLERRWGATRAWLYKEIQ